MPTDGTDVKVSGVNLEVGYAKFEQHFEQFKIDNFEVYIIQFLKSDSFLILKAIALYSTNIDLCKSRALFNDTDWLKVFKASAIFLPSFYRCTQ